MDKTLQGYIDKLNKLNFKEMYEGDFFLTWEKTDDELEAVWTVADALRYMRENNISTNLKADWVFPYSVTIPPEPGSPSLLPATCWVWRFRIWMKENLRLLTARLFVKLQT